MIRKMYSMIEIKNVSKTYNGTKKALDNVSLKITSGEIFAFIGHNGAGKTTMIKSIVGILDFEEGDITINGKSIKEDPIGCKLDMAYVPDNPDLYENMKAIDFINFICDMYDISTRKRKEKMVEISTNCDFAILPKDSDILRSYKVGYYECSICKTLHRVKAYQMDGYNTR